MLKTLHNVLRHWDEVIADIDITNRILVEIEEDVHRLEARLNKLEAKPIKPKKEKKGINP